MFYIDNDSGVTVMPPVSAQRSAIVRWFSEGDGNNVITWPGMDWFNIVQAELLNTLEEAGIQPDKTKLNQLALSIKAIMSNNALLIKNNLSEIKTAGASAQRTARENLDIYDASLNKKGLVQLTSATDSPSETLAATAKAVKIAMDNANARLAKDRNGADIPNKPLFIQNLGLQETVNKAGNAVQRSGDTMTGKLNLPQTSAFGVNTDNALGGNSITLGDNDTGIKQGGDGVLLFYLNGQLIFGLQPTSADFYKRVAYIHQGVAPDGSGAFADQLNNATAPFVQTQFAWNPTPGGHYVPIAKGLSIRNGQGYPGAVSFGYLLTEQMGFPIPCIHMRGDYGADALWQFNPNDKSFISPGALVAGGIRYNTDGNIFGGCWGSNLADYLNSTYVRDIRLGSAESISAWRGPGYWDTSGYVLTAAGNSNTDEFIDTLTRRPIQKLIGGTYYNVVSI
ncbi:phage tail protein [Escherichia coli]|uniref:tail fiber protein n=2 Tax=Escherichia coli TaxID=562 RepID=UPI00054334C7|nr:tail fiber protein [Escherichia coli]ECF3223179.1 phage tail protein [Salmonella enterica subsp. enterica serovar Nottingham]EDP8734644.1 phage tail protein [Salmonella enterica subsp. enterica]HAF1741443.1 phage tail protein [Salmonella enterica]EDW0362028.1 phage tail protein [Salmonella enterica subsp. enterica]EFB3080223.1 phage tail protein [Escherichia coli]